MDLKAEIAKPISYETMNLFKINPLIETKQNPESVVAIPESRDVVILPESRNVVVESGKNVGGGGLVVPKVSFIRKYKTVILTACFTSMVFMILILVGALAASLSLLLPPKLEKTESTTASTAGAVNTIPPLTSSTSSSTTTTISTTSSSTTTPTTTTTTSTTTTTIITTTTLLAGGIGSPCQMSVNCLGFVVNGVDDPIKTFQTTDCLQTGCACIGLYTTLSLSPIYRCVLPAGSYCLDRIQCLNACTANSCS